MTLQLPPANFGRILLLSLFIAGCASAPRIDWDSRIGVYTFEEAKEDMGEPTQILQFNDETFLAEWILGQNPVMAPAAASTSPGGYGPRRNLIDREALETLANSASLADFLQLTFSAEGRLLRWEKGEK